MDYQVMNAFAVMVPVGWGNGPQEPHLRLSFDRLTRALSETIPPTPATLPIWADSPGYLHRHDPIEVYLAVDPAGDRKAYREFIFI